MFSLSQEQIELLALLTSSVLGYGHTAEAAFAGQWSGTNWSDKQIHADVVKNKKRPGHMWVL